MLTNPTRGEMEGETSEEKRGIINQNGSDPDTERKSTEKINGGHRKGKNHFFIRKKDNPTENTFDSH
ncbi:hypothetical protein RUM44_013812 [Polyplax serrata]|uniref:Uncharacterized protein n=1 Tax=Polyplax serrata TaxID=468196 RepID=A0ABR1BIS5_POLSC